MAVPHSITVCKLNQMSFRPYIARSHRLSACCIFPSRAHSVPDSEKTRCTQLIHNTVHSVHMQYTSLTKALLVHHAYANRTFRYCLKILDIKQIGFGVFGLRTGRLHSRDSRGRITSPSPPLFLHSKKTSTQKRSQKPKAQSPGICAAL